MEQKDRKKRITESYIDYVLSHGEAPKSVYLLMKKLRLKEEYFYEYYPSFEALESSIWSELCHNTIATITSQKEFATFSAREKTLSFFYAFIEALKPQRSFIIHSFKKATPRFGTPTVLKEMRGEFEAFCVEIIHGGLESQELNERKFISNKYKDALWLQLIFILRFWIQDSSRDFEKTDEAIEKGLNLTFELMGRSPIDDLLEYGKFLVKNARFVYEGAK